MTLQSTLTRAPAAPVPSLEALAAEAVRLGREAAAAAQEVGVGRTPGDWRRAEAILEGLAERVPFALTDETLAEAERILARNVEAERDGTERRVVDRAYDEDGGCYDILEEVSAHTPRGRALIEVQVRLREFAAARDRVLDRVAAEAALRDLRAA